MLIGPVFTREATILPRRPRLYFLRVVYATALLVLMCTAWLVIAGTQVIRNVGDLARFGAVLFQILAPLQMALVVFLAALQSAGAIAQEKDRKTLILLLMTRMTNREVVLGKLGASLLPVLAMLVTALPVFMSIQLFGGVSFAQVIRVFAVTLATALAAGSLGATLAFWREKTFQTLALTALVLVFWVGGWEAVGLLEGADPLFGVGWNTWSTGFSPVRAILTASGSVIPVDDALGPLGHGVNLFFVASACVTVLLCGIAIWRVRIWNPSRELRPRQAEDERSASIWGAEHDLASKDDAAGSRESAAEAQRAEHVDARVRKADGKTRQVWDNPVLWREMRTWAYGKKVIVIRVAYGLLFALIMVGLHRATETGETFSNEVGTTTNLATRLMAPFLLLSLVIVNALAVNSITNERDGRSLDLLLVTELSPREFLFGKLGGVFWVTKEMVLLPLAAAVYLWARGGIGLENLSYLLGGLAVMYIFVAMLGIHCGMIYSNSRTSIGVSLGTVFFLFLGVVTLILMMISFSGSFQTQLGPFLAFVVGGAIGLFVSLGLRNPSPAIALASLIVPIATFFAVTSFLLDRSLSAFLVISATYGFTTAAMMMPALGEFDIAMGRAKTAEDE